jgi:hypothetical protein
MMKLLMWGALAAAALAPAPRPLPPFWDRLVDEEPLEAACSVIHPPLIWQVSEDRRNEASTMLGEELARLLTHEKALSIIGIAPQPGQPAADLAFRAALDRLRLRVSRGGAGDTPERRHLARMSARLEEGAHRQYRP